MSLRGNPVAALPVPDHPQYVETWTALPLGLRESKLVDRFVRNLRRVAGFGVQYFATVEQRGSWRTRPRSYAQNGI